jgi:hypothetical protein
VFSSVTTSSPVRRTLMVNMKDLIADSAARWQYRLHLAALALLLPSP